MTEKKKTRYRGDRKKEKKNSSRGDRKKDQIKKLGLGVTGKKTSLGVTKKTRSMGDGKKEKKKKIALGVTEKKKPVAFANIVDGKGVQCIQRTRLTLKDLDYLFKILMTKILITKTNRG